MLFNDDKERFKNNEITFDYNGNIVYNLIVMEIYYPGVIRIVLKSIPCDMSA